MEHDQSNIKFPPYPARLSIEYPEKLCRISTLLRLLYIIPIILVLGLISGSPLFFGNVAVYSVTGPGVLFLAIVAMLLFRKKYPRWWFDWNLELSRFQMRVMSYLCLLRDEYPSTDEMQAVHLDMDYPDAQNLNRVLPLFKWFLAIPHFIILLILVIPAILSVIVAWFAILITGRYPRPLFNFIEGCLRWSLRVNAYCIFLNTDQYPPFSLRA